MKELQQLRDELDRLRAERVILLGVYKRLQIVDKSLKRVEDYMNELLKEHGEG